MRRMAVLTSGGDAPGMNAALRAVARAADARGVEAYGVHQGYAGLMDGRLTQLTARSVSGILHLGGTMLGTGRAPAFTTKMGRQRAYEELAAAEIDALVVIGGDGSMRGAAAVSAETDIRTVGIPGTIDNDLTGTDYTLGFDTAVNTALDAVDKIRDTAASHGRLFFIEVMGRHSGWLALTAGLAGGATDVLVPERPTDIAALRERIAASFALGKQYCLVVVAEGDDAGGAFEIAKKVAEGNPFDYRVTILGHVQRGGPATMRDRLLGAVLGDAAVQALLNGRNGVMVGEIKGEIVFTPLAETFAGETRDMDRLLDLMDRLAR